MLRTNGLRERLRALQPAFGVINSSGSPVLTELAGLAGYDFIVIDGEHGPGTPDDHRACLWAGQATPATILLRVPELADMPIRLALDLGFEGILVPDVRSAEEARRAASVCRYPPAGHRGVASRGIRASDYGLKAAEYSAAFGAGELFLTIMVEHPDGVEDIEAIAGVGGVDAILVGPTDLSANMGVTTDSPVFLDTLARIEAAVRASGKALGGIPTPACPLPVMLERGYTFITTGSDISLLRGAMTADLAAARATAAQ